jgi:hypothetical protein
MGLLGGHEGLWPGQPLAPVPDRHLFDDISEPGQIAAILDVGLREGSYITLLGWLGVDGEKALAFSLMIFFIQILFAIWGLFLDLNWHLRYKKNRIEEHKD